MHHRFRSLSNALTVLLAWGIATCGNPVSPGDEPNDPGNNLPGQIASLTLDVPALLPVQGTALIGVTGKDAQGRVVALPAQPVFSSSDASLMEVTPAGVVKGLRRGRATITVSSGTLSTTMTIGIVARLDIAPAYVPPWGNRLRMVIEDRLQLGLLVTDVNGVPLDDILPVDWSSSNPLTASVSSDGLVVTHAPGLVTITGLTDDGAVSRTIEVWGEQAGFPATVRYAHAIKGHGPITFRPSKGDPVTLSYGESVELSILSGSLIIETSGFPQGLPDNESFKAYGALLRSGNRLSLFAVGGPAQGLLVPVWDVPHRPVAPDSGLFRLVQGWNPFLVAYLVDTGQPPTGLPAHCYFDPTLITDYFVRPAGGFDVVLLTKYGAPTQNRLSTQMEGGRSITAVIAGDTPGAMELLLFPDP